MGDESVSGVNSLLGSHEDDELLFFVLATCFKLRKRHPAAVAVTPPPFWTKTSWQGGRASPVQQLQSDDIKKGDSFCQAKRFPLKNAFWRLLHLSSHLFPPSFRHSTGHHSSGSPSYRRLYRSSSHILHPHAVSWWRNGFDSFAQWWEATGGWGGCWCRLQQTRMLR